MKSKQLFSKFLMSFIILPVLLCSLSGCIYLIAGGIGAVGGYIVSPDTVEGIAEEDILTVWETAYDVVSIMGTIQQEQEDVGILIANVSGARVTITLVSLTQSTVKVNVKARKAYLPKISVAQEVFVKIMGRVNQ